MMNTNLLAVVKQTSIYHGCSNWEILWEEDFTIGDFSAVNINCFGRRNVRKHRDIKGSDKYATLEISLKFVSLDKMRITSLEKKYNLGR